MPCSIPVAIAAAPATAAPRDPVVYDALGDSYGSGYGVPPYSATCGRSDAAYAVQIDGRMRIDLDIAEAAAEAGFQFVDVTSRFVEHGVNAPEPWVLGITDRTCSTPTSPATRPTPPPSAPR